MVIVLVSLILLLGPVTLARGSAQCADDEFDPGRATAAELFFHMQRYATTDVKKERKRAAREEFKSRGTNALIYLIENVHITNFWFQNSAREMVVELKAEEAAPILLRAAMGERKRTRQVAVFLLGFHDMPAYADRIMPFLEDDETAGVAIRTLGKWRVGDAVTRIVPFLCHEKERRRIVAVNALKDIGDRRAAPHLVELLDDPYFTVRKSAARALVSLGKPVECDVIDALSGASRTAQRELIGVLGGLASRKAIRPLRRLLGHEDRMIRRGAARALGDIDPRRAARWIRKAGLDPGLCPAQRGGCLPP